MVGSTLRRWTHGIMVVALAVAWSGQVRADEPRFTRTEVRVDVPDVTLIDQNGNRVKLREILLGDRPAFVEFIYATCTTICPVLSAGYASIQRKFGSESERVALVSITIDPEHDNPAELRKYLERYGARPGWSFLTGTREQINEVMRAFDAFVADKMSHRPIVIIHTPGEDEWIRLYGFPGSKDLLGELERAEKDDSD